MACHGLVGKWGEGLPWSSFLSERTCGLAGWGSFLSRRDERGPWEGASVYALRFASSMTTYHVLPGREPWPALLIDGHFCIFRGYWGRGSAGLCEVAVLHIEEKFVSSFDGDKGRFGCHNGLLERCRRRHLDRYASFLCGTAWEYSKAAGREVRGLGRGSSSVAFLTVESPILVGWNLCSKKWQTHKCIPAYLLAGCQPCMGRPDHPCYRPGPR